MRGSDFFAQHRLHLGLIALRSLAVLVLVLAGGTIATQIMGNFLVALILGTMAGLALGLLVDQAALAHGRRLGRIEMQDHAGRQAEARAGRDRRADSLHNRARDLPLRPGGGTAAAAAAASTYAQAYRVTASGPEAAARAAAHGLTSDLEAAAPAHPLAPALDALERLCDLMLLELRPQDLVGQQGRGVIQLAADLGPQVPELEPDTVVAYISDHVLVAAGQDPEHPERWHGQLSRVEKLPSPTGVAGAEVSEVQLLGLAQAADGGDPGPFLDMVVDRIAGSGTGLAPSQLSVVLATHGARIGLYTLAGVLKYLVDQGRLDRPFGAARFTLTDAEWERRAAAGLDQQQGRPPLDVVWSALAGGPAAGMHLGEVAAEVTRRREIPCTLGGAAAALDALVRAGRAQARDGMFLALNPLAESLISGPGLRARIIQAVTGSPSGLTVAEIAERVNADGFGAPLDEVRAMAEKFVGSGELVRSGDRYTEPPF